MSLESVIAENTKAIKELIDALRETGTGRAGDCNNTDSNNPGVTATGNLNMDDRVIEQTDVEDDKNDDIDTEESEKELTYDDVRNATLAFVKSHGKGLTEEILSKFNASRVPQLPKELWQKYLDALSAEASKNGD